MPIILTDIGIVLAILGAWLQLVDSQNEFTIKCLAAGGVFLLAGWVLS
jgi:type III secretory pathway component EscS